VLEIPDVSLKASEDFFFTHDTVLEEES